MNNYDLPVMRKQLISVLAKSLDKSSKWYKDDYEAICAGVNRKTRKELIESLDRQNAVNGVSKELIKRHCQC